jgi:hypothetical protein
MDEVVDAHHELLVALGLGDTINVSPAEAMLKAADLLRLREGDQPVAWLCHVEDGDFVTLEEPDYGSFRVTPLYARPSSPPPGWLDNDARLVMLQLKLQLRLMIKYARWQMSEGSTFHPTLGSAIDSAQITLDNAEQFDSAMLAAAPEAMT